MPLSEAGDTACSFGADEARGLEIDDLCLYVPHIGSALRVIAELPRSKTGDRNLTNKHGGQVIAREEDKRTHVPG